VGKQLSVDGGIYLEGGATLILADICGFGDPFVFTFPSHINCEEMKDRRGMFGQVFSKW